MCKPKRFSQGKLIRENLFISLYIPSNIFKKNHDEKTGPFYDPLDPPLSLFTGTPLSLRKGSCLRRGLEFYDIQRCRQWQLDESPGTLQLGIPWIWELYLR